MAENDNGEIAFDEGEADRIKGRLLKLAGEVAGNGFVQKLSTDSNKLLPGSTQEAENLKTTVSGLISSSSTQLHTVTSKTLPKMGDNLDATKQKFQQNEQDNKDHTTQFLQDVTGKY
ncbi:hypothetical protein [Saccharopolyspora sp. NPDC002376]